MFCSQCGKEYQDGSKFCPSCGFNLETKMTTQNNNQQNSMQIDLLEVRAKEKSLAIAGLINILLVGAGYFYVGKYIWGTIIIISAILAVIYAPEAILGLEVLSICGSIYAAHKYNQSLLEDVLRSKTYGSDQQKNILL